MQNLNMTSMAETAQDYITIVAPSIGEVMRRFKDSGLAAQGYSITGPIGRHTFYGCDGGSDPFGGEPMTAATFARSR